MLFVLYRHLYERLCNTFHYKTVSVAYVANIWAEIFHAGCLLQAEFLGKVSIKILEPFQGMRRGGKTIFCSCLLKLLQALDSEITAPTFFGARTWIIRKVERMRKEKMGVEEISLERVCSCLLLWTVGKKAHKPHAFQNRVNEWLGAEWSSLFHCTYMMYWFEGERIMRCKQNHMLQKTWLKCAQWWN